MKTLFCAPLIAAAIFSCVLPAKAAKADEGYRVRAVSSQAGAVPSEVYVHDAEGKTSAGKLMVKTFLNHQFDLLETKGGAVVFSSKPDPASAKNEADVIGRGELPAKAASLILFFAPESPGQPKCKVTVIDASAKEFPAGSFKVVNLSSLPIRIELEADKYEFKPGETKVIAKPPMGDAGAAGMKAFCQRDGKWDAISSGIWPNPGDKRVLQVISENTANKQVEIVGIRDVAKP